MPACADRSDTIMRAGAAMAICMMLALLLFAVPAFAQAAPAAAPPLFDNGGALTRALGQGSGDGRSLSLSLQILILMSLLTVLPSLVLMMTSFTRIIIVLSLLRQALVATGLFNTVSVVPEQSGEAVGDGTEYAPILVEQDAGPPRTLAASGGVVTA